MKRQRSAGAVVVSTDLHEPRTLLLDQVRHNGEHQTVAPKGRIEPGESPLTAARREVAEEAGITDPLYAGYLGQESYGFTDRDGSPGHKTVDWFLFATDTTDTVPLADEGFHQARWAALDRANAAVTHPEFRRFLDQAADIVAWRSTLGFSRALSNLTWSYSGAASSVLADEPAAAIALCGSAARGDFVDGWSDIDLVGSGIGPAVADQLTKLTGRLAESQGVRCSIRFTDRQDVDHSGTGSLGDLKVRGVLAQAGIDVPGIAGAGQLASVQDRAPDDLVAAVAACHGFAVQRLAAPAESAADSVDRVRRALSALSNAARLLTAAESPAGSLRLANVVDFLVVELPTTRTATILAEYDQIRRNGTVADLTRLEALAEQVPAALYELGKHAASVQPGAEAAE